MDQMEMGSHYILASSSNTHLHIFITGIHVLQKKCKMLFKLEDSFKILDLHPMPQKRLVK